MFEEALDFVMKFYGIDRETATNLYRDEIEAYMNFLEMEKTEGV